MCVFSRFLCHVYMVCDGHAQDGLPMWYESVGCVLHKCFQCESVGVFLLGIV